MFFNLNLMGNIKFRLTFDKKFVKHGISRSLYFIMVDNFTFICYNNSWGEHFEEV